MILDYPCCFFPFLAFRIEPNIFRHCSQLNRATVEPCGIGQLWSVNDLCPGLFGHSEPLPRSLSVTSGSWAQNTNPGWQDTMITLTGKSRWIEQLLNRVFMELNRVIDYQVWAHFSHMLKSGCPLSSPGTESAGLCPNPSGMGSSRLCGSSYLSCRWEALMFISILFSSPNVDSIAVMGQDLLGAEDTEMSTRE